ncbi:geranylgeranyl transferase beta subunit, putative [Talaromyces stipitatus ATCC 10500]|uniref:Geranylgeranyl transferase beta subunit, putative n=1 Tax=Talaromyces stipitatus (strain ATCC 10500 / CBS 375.48 / QM 6759 / NRRL 1006) TaxID=441959 RepID=B8MKE3_TALSN|nr:geranylgeranyl transferase beta subunit, putative [Talaromyces stipitatus ATCC 10500]EED15298.1 geranylgeranyl transferase beta subunit, putative [Talaromyces stipitatus ATCC 10500]
MSSTTFNKERHIKYFLRCLKTLLPYQYTTGDGGRVLLGFFTIAGLDLLGVLHEQTTPEERQGYINWIYHCQHPRGGFRGFTGTKFGDAQHDRDNAGWDPANIPSTFLALETLLILGDDLSRVKRKECLKWLPKLQRQDGSFGDMLGADERIVGGNDLRFCYCAAGIRYFLRGPYGAGVEDVRDIDVAKLVSFVQSCQSYDGGMGETPFREAHAGLTYCAVGALALLQRTGSLGAQLAVLSPKTENYQSLLRWLVSRQTSDLGAEDEEDDEADTKGDSASTVETQDESTTNLSEQIDKLPECLPIHEESLKWAGFNGRLNKIADTCYCFWVTGTLGTMNQLSLIDAPGVRHYLLDKTQHIVGGFGKSVGEVPDIYHSYLGMISLALINEPGLEPADPTLCTGVSVMQNLKSLLWWKEG